MEESRTSSQVSIANRIINSLSKEITPSRVKRGELCGEHVLMSFMTLQIMHYRQEQSGGSKHNCIDFSLMVTNNDIFLNPWEGHGWVGRPKGTHTGSYTRSDPHDASENIIPQQAHTHTHSEAFAYVHVQVIIFSHLARTQTEYTPPCIQNTDT